MPTPSNERGQFRFTVPLADVKMDASGDPAANGRMTMRGHAAVFNQPSHDLGGFRVTIQPGFFTNILASSPDVHLNREHDMRLLLGRTRNGSLELTETDAGLRAWAMFPNTPLAAETATLMSEGYLDQMSFACDIADSQWIEDQDGNVTWNLIECGGLYDVTICAQGAFPQTDSRLAASMKDAGAQLAAARAAGFVASRDGEGELTVAQPEAAGGDTVAPDEGGATVADESQGARNLAAFKLRTRARMARLVSSD